MFLHSISMGMGVGEKEGELRLTKHKCKVFVSQLSMGDNFSCFYGWFDF